MPFSAIISHIHCLIRFPNPLPVASFEIETRKRPYVCVFDWMVEKNLKTAVRKNACAFFAAAVGLFYVTTQSAV